jgi:ParB family chromosome partitioning protein
MALVENVQRENLNAMEVAITFDRILNEYNLTYDELGRKVGKDRSTVNNYLRLLKLPSEIQKLIIIGKVSMGHARAIIGLDSIENQKIIIQRILNEQLSVRTVEDLVKTLHKKEIYPPSLPSNQDFQEYINNELFASNQSRLTDIKVKIDKDGEKGALFLSFNNEQDLERIVIHLDKIFQNQEFNH